MTRPAKLQINQLGAWRDVMRFDLDTLADKSLFLDAAAEMVRSTGLTETTMRVVIDMNSYLKPPVLLMTWGVAAGWEKVAMP